MLLNTEKSGEQDKECFFRMVEYVPRILIFCRLLIFMSTFRMSNKICASPKRVNSIPLRAHFCLYIKCKIYVNVLADPNLVSA